MPIGDLIDLKKNGIKTLLEKPSPIKKDAAILQSLLTKIEF